MDTIIDPVSKLDYSQRRMFDKHTEHRPVVQEGCPDAQTVWLKVGGQALQLQVNCEDVAEAIWFRCMLAKALDAIKRAD